MVVSKNTDTVMDKIQEQTLLTFVKDFFDQLECSQKEMANLIREIHTDVAILKEQQNRTDKVWGALEERFQLIETNVTRLEHQLQNLEEYRKHFVESSSFWRDLFTTKAFDLVVSAGLILGGVLVGHFIEFKEPTVKPEVINGR